MQQLTAGTSVLICSYNGAKNVAETLRHLAAQQTRPGLPLEILLVDNASTDGTGQVAVQCWKNEGEPFPLRLIAEPRPGKNNAMDTGLQLAQYDCVVVCDDDNWLDANYLQLAFDIMHAYPAIGMLGGRGVAVFEAEPPAWFAHLENYYAVGTQHATTGEVTSGKGFLWGAGAVINKRAYQRLLAAGFQRIITHENHAGVARGEDVELCLALKLAGYKVWYDERLVYRHFINRDKLQWNYLIRLTKEGGLAGPLVLPYQMLIENKSTRYASGKSWLRWVLKRNTRGGDLLNYLRLRRTGNREGDLTYQRRLASHYYFLGMLRLNRTYDQYVRQVGRLRAGIDRREPVRGATLPGANTAEYVN